mgnify:CR=1 FL=1|tara:strand:+ start:1396 stop:1584 length:189 start_codon:yes stop_codon:yes gene_type:complete
MTIDTTNLLQSAQDGNLTDFQNHFNVAMSSAVTSKMNSMKADISSSVRIDGEYDLDSGAKDE